MCECEVCRRKKNRDPLNREFEPKKRVPEPKKEDCEPKKEDCESKKEDCESLNYYSFSKNANFLEKA
ncbi:spore coat protein, partial [Bacillus thuringiensis]